MSQLSLAAIWSALIPGPAPAQSSPEVVGWDSNGLVMQVTGTSNLIAIAARQGTYLALRSDGTVLRLWSGTSVPSALTNLVAVTPRLGLRTDGTVVAWGPSSVDEVPQAGSNVVGIAEGQDHRMALCGNGTVRVWGDNAFGQTNVPPGLSNVIAIAAGLNHCLALRFDGTVAAWGNTAPPPEDLTNVVSLAGGLRHSLALRSDRTVVGWGDNSLGQITVPDDPNEYVAIAAGDFHNLAVRPEGTVVSWGDISTVPDGLSDVVAIQATRSMGLALRPAGAPAITKHPLGGIAYRGQTRILLASAAGCFPLRYRWQCNGADVPFATNFFLVLPDIQPAQAGEYRVVVANDFGEQTSRAATIEVADSPPVLWLEPEAQRVYSWQAGRLFVGVDGSWPLEYKWYHNGDAIPGGHRAILLINNPDYDDAGEYWAVVSNAFGVVTTAVAVLTLREVSAWGGPPSPPENLTNVVMVSAGRAHSLALRSNGTILGWGDNGFGQLNPPSDLSNVLAVAAGGVYSLALGWDGTVRAWGDQTYGLTTVPPDLTNCMAVAAGDLHVVALRSDGTAVAWGRNNYGQTNVPAGLHNLVAVAAGRDHCLALRSDGTVVAWGKNDSGQSTVPLNLSNVVAIAGGDGHSIVLHADSTMTAWGLNSDGQGEIPAGLTNVAGIAAALAYNVALRRNGTVSAWGESVTNVPTGLSNVVAVSAGRFQGLALSALGPPTITGNPRGGSILRGHAHLLIASASGRFPLHYQWQFNETDIPGATNWFLQLDNMQPEQAGRYRVSVTNPLGQVLSRAAAVELLDAPPVLLTQPPSRRAYLGATIGFGISTEGSWPISYQWYHDGVPLPGATEQSLLLTSLGLTNFGSYWVVVSNAFGAVTSPPVALTIQEVVAWGNNSFGQIDVPDWLSNVVAVAGGGTLANLYSLALLSDGKVVIWGDNAYGQTNVPAGLSNVVAVSAGQSHILALREDGRLVAWGNNQYGQASIPSGLSNVVGIAAGRTHSVAIRSDGVVIGWGQNNYGQLNVPANLSNVVAVAAGEGHSLALRMDGAVVAWGWNYSRQTNVPPDLSSATAVAAGGRSSLALPREGAVAAWGDNSYGQTNVPAGLNDALAIAAGYRHCLALRSDGTVIVWGSNAYGETNLPPGLNSVCAIAAGGLHSLALAYPKAPRVLVQPYDALLSVGETRVFVASAVGQFPLSYQWYRNGHRIVGATNAWLPVVAADWADEGLYFVTVSNALGSASSRPAVLQVIGDVASSTRLQALAPSCWPAVLMLGYADGRLLSEADLPRFEVTATTNFVTWETVNVTMILTNGQAQARERDPAIRRPQRYYRVLTH